MLAGVQQEHTYDGLEPQIHDVQPKRRAEAGALRRSRAKVDPVGTLLLSGRRITCYSPIQRVRWSNPWPISAAVAVRIGTDFPTRMNSTRREVTGPCRRTRTGVPSSKPPALSPATEQLERSDPSNFKGSRDVNTPNSSGPLTASGTTTTTSIVIVTPRTSPAANHHQRAMTFIEGWADEEGRLPGSLLREGPHEPRLGSCERRGWRENESFDQHGRGFPPTSSCPAASWGAIGGRALG